MTCKRSKCGSTYTATLLLQAVPARRVTRPPGLEHLRARHSQNSRQSTGSNHHWGTLAQRRERFSVRYRNRDPGIALDTPQRNPPIWVDFVVPNGLSFGSSDGEYLPVT